MTTDDEKFLAECQARADAATPGPWNVKQTPNGKRCDGITRDHSHGENECCWDVDDCPYREEIVTTDCGHYGPNLSDAYFIAAARSDIPRLIALVRDEAAKDKEATP